MNITQQLTERLNTPSDYDDLLKLYLQHLGDLEMQIRGDKSLRIPKKAGDGFVFNDSNYDLGTIAEIGSSGWLWRSQNSLWVGYDIDSLTGHAPGVGISDNELRRVQEAACELPYVQVRRSTSGSGLHLYVFLTNIQSATRADHAAVAKCVLQQMSNDVQFDFKSRVDVGGLILWGCSDRATNQNQGLTLVKQAERAFDVSELPDNWRDQVAVVTGDRTTSAGVAREDEGKFDELTGGTAKVPLDRQHDQLVAHLGTKASWSREHHLLQTHTQLLVDAHKELGLKGRFETNSPGSDLSTHNCFLFPRENGSWRVVRFGRNTQEVDSWQISEAGWTWCYFNSTVSFVQACEHQGATLLNPNEYWFKRLDHVGLALALVDITLPDGAADAQAWAMWDPRSGQVTVKFSDSVRGRAGEQHPAFEGWFWRTGKWVCQAGVIPPDAGQDDPAEAFEEGLRRLRDPEAQPCGWALKDASDRWVPEGDHAVKCALKSEGLDATTADSVMGTMIKNSWTLVTIPFEKEYPGNRQWNRNAPQLAFQPTEEEGEHPHWDLVLNHIGQYLDDSFSDGVLPFNSGKEYLMAWMASVIQCPFEPLPYIFLYGGENAGKSIFHEAFDLLLTRGVVRADRALTNETFNAELEGAVVCVVEETNLGDNRKAAAKLKDFVTSRKLSIRRMRRDSVMVPNTSHWVQCSNELDAVPAFAGDTRVVMVLVHPVASEIPKTILLSKLKAEAPAFLRSLLNTRLPPHEGRLRIPVVETDLKKEAMRANERDPIREFLANFTNASSGEFVSFNDFYAAFVSFLDSSESFGKQKVSQALRRAGMQVERSGNGQTIIQNISLSGGIQQVGE